MPVHGCFCFVAPEGLFADVGLPIMRTLRINGFSLYYVRKLAKQLNQTGPVLPEQIARARAALAERLPSA